MGLRIAYISSTFPNYQACGTGIYAGYLTQSLAEQNHDVHVITSAIPEIAPSLGKVKVHKLLSSWHPSELPKVLFELSKINPDIIHFNHPTAIAGQKSKTLVNILPLTLKNFSKKPIVTTLHEFNKVSLLGRLKILPMCLGSDIITVTNREYQKALSNHLPQSFASKIRVVNIGAQVNHLLPEGSRTTERSKWGLDSDDTVIGFVGFITPPKGFHNLITACIPILKSNPKLKILALSSWNMTSPSYRLQITEAIRKAGVENQVIFTGFLSEDEVWKAFSAIDLCVFPFEYPIEERSSGPIRQVLYYGLPTIAWAKSLNYDEFGLKHDENIILSLHGDLEVLRRNILNLAGSLESRQKLAAGAKSLRGILSFDHVSNEMSRIYADLASQAP